MIVSEPADNRWCQEARQTGQPGHDGQSQPGRKPFDIVGGRVGHGYGHGASRPGDRHPEQRPGNGGEQEGDAHSESDQRSTPGDHGSLTDSIDDAVAHQAPHDHRSLKGHQPQPDVTGASTLVRQEEGRPVHGDVLGEHRGGAQQPDDEEHEYRDRPGATRCRRRSHLGGVIVDGGTFDWKADPGKFPGFNKPDASYHGLVFGDVPAPFATRVRTLLLRDQGAAISPFNAFLLLQGLETLSLRVERHVYNTRKVLEYLEKQPLVKKINHPAVASHPNHDLYQRYFPNGAGSIFTIELDGDQQKAFDFIDHLKVFSLLANVADLKSLVIHPLSTTHSELSVEEAAGQGIYPNTVRLSIGTEHYEDIIADLDQAFEAVK